MPVFVILGNWTDLGIRKITEEPARAKAAHDMFNKAVGKMQLFYTLRTAIEPHNIKNLVSRITFFEKQFNNGNNILPKIITTKNRKRPIKY